MIKHYKGHDKNSKKTAFLTFLFLFLLGNSLVFAGVPARPFDNAYPNKKIFPQKIFLNIDDGLITLIAKNIPLGSIMDEISRKSGIKISISPALRSKKVTIEWRDMPFEEGIKKIAGNSGLVFEKDEEGSFLLSEVHVVPSSTEKFLKDQEKTEQSSGPDKPRNGKQLNTGRADAAGISSEKELSENRSQEEKPDIVLNEMVIRFNQAVPKEDIDRFLSDAHIKVKKYIAALDYHILSLPDGMTYYDALVMLKNRKMLYQAEPNYLIPVKDMPDDSYFNLQWGLNNTGASGGIEDADMDAVEAWDIETGNSGTIIAVIDTGVDYLHEDLTGNIWHNAGEIPDNNIDDDNNGFIDDTIGWDFVDASSGDSGEDFKDPDNDPMDRQGHGTHVAGIAAAVGNNGTGIAGIAFNCRIMSVRAGYMDLSGNGVLESADAAQAIIYAAENGAKVINLSWGDYAESNLIKSAISIAAEKGALICAAAGNDNSSNRLFPAATDNPAIIAVGATDSTDNRAGFSNYGDWVHVSAPGKDIYSLKPGNSYVSMSGTSMAAPHVAGLAGLIFSCFEGITPLEVKARIMNSVDVSEALEGANITGGRINAYSALTSDAPVPYIFSVNPVPASEGESVSIYGYGFGDQQSEGRVMISDYAMLETISWSDTLIVCRAPWGQQSGDLTVTAKDGMSNPVAFNVVTSLYDEEISENQFINAGEAQNWQGDDKSWVYDLPFIFTFFGKEYERLYVSSNGFIDFTDNSASYLSSAEKLKERTMIAPLWDDLVINQSVDMNQDIYIHMPSDESVCIRWNAEAFSTEGKISVEIVLYRDGRIQFNYGSGNSDLSPVIGISAGDKNNYVISGYDGKNNLENADTVIFTPHDQTFTVTLKKGWNLISVPLQPYDSGIMDLLGEAYDKIESVWTYRDSVWETHVAGNSFVSDFNDMNESYGYWVKSNEDSARIKVLGDADTRPLELSEGWNLIGYNSLVTRSISEVLSSISDRVNSVWAFKNGKWIMYDPDNPGFSDLTAIEPGLGYWINVRESCTWSQ